MITLALLLIFSVTLNVILARTIRRGRHNVRLAERLAREETINNIKGMMSGN